MSTNEQRSTVTSQVLAGSVTESTEKVERIREILFGAQLREYGQKFDLLQRELARLQQEVGRLNEQVREQDKTLRKQMREESDRLVAQLQDQDARQTQQLQASEQRQLQQLHDLDQRHTQHAQQFGEQIRRSERALLDELGHVAVQLNHNKADRDTLGALLIDLGTNLKSNDPVPLQKVTDVVDLLGEELQQTVG